MMRTRTQRVTTNLLVLLAAFLLGPLQGMAQDDPGKDDSINEQTIYIPYDKLREVFERDGRGVFLPYEKFQELWNEARKKQPKEIDTSAPLGALITDIESVATLGKEIVNVDAKIKIELLRTGWHRIPLRLNHSAIRQATIDGQEARVISLPDGNYELLVSHDSDDPKTVELEISYAKASAKNGGQSTVEFQSPQAPVNRWMIRTGEKDIDVQIEPMIASTKKSISDPAEDNVSEGEEILAFVGAAPEVKILWTPKSEGASGLSALVAADTQSQFRIDQGVARTSALVNLDISRAEIDQVKIKLPADQKVVSVFDRNVKKWNVEEGEETQIVTVELFEAAVGRQALALELEKFVDEIDKAEISIPQVQVESATRNSGMVLVGLTAGLRAEPEKKEGLLQIDTAELPQNLRKQNWDFAYRYAAVPFQLTLDVKKIQPLINVDQLVEVVLKPERLNVQLSTMFDIQLAGVFQVELSIPEEFEIRDVRSLPLQGGTSVPVDTFYRDSQNAERVIVTLGKKALGKLRLVASLERELSDPNLLTPTGTASKIDLTLPKASLDGIEFSKGGLVVYAPESLQVNAGETKGLRNESFEQTRLGRQSMVQTSGVRPILAFGYSHTDASIEIEARRRRPQVTVEQVVVATVQSGVIKYDARLFYQVQYSGVESLRLDVPTSLAGAIRNRTRNVLHQVLDPQPENVPEGFTAWQLTGENEFFGKQNLRFTWEEKIADLPLGESTEIPVARLQPTDVDRSTGQIVLAKSETIDVRPNADATGLRPIDPQTDLAQGVKVENAAMAFEFVDDWSLELTATRFELQDLKRTSISKAVARVVALRQDELSVQCLYQMRSVGQRISIQMPAGFDAATSFDDQPIRVNGQRVTPERGGKDLIYVPLTGIKSNDTFLLEVRYTIPGNHNQIDLPVFPEEPAVQKVYLCVYLPYEQALLHKSGAWTDEAIDQHNLSIVGLLGANQANSSIARMFRRRNENVDQYVQWVHEGTNCAPASNSKFEVDGRPYVFSALRPEPAPAGTLSLRTINMNLLNVMVCVIVGLVGLVLLRARPNLQIAGGLALLAVFFLTGIFFPLITEHIFAEPLLLTAGVVVVFWLVWDVRRWISEFIRARSQTRTEMLGEPVVAADGGPGYGQPAVDEVNLSRESGTDLPSDDSDHEGGES